MALLLILGTVTQAQAPAALLKDAQAELQAAAKALNDSEVFQRYQRAKRIAEGLEALAKAEAKPAEKKPETGSK